MTMFLRWNRFAAVAAVVAVHASMYPSLASDGEAEEGGNDQFLEGFRRGLMASSFMGGDLFGEGNMLQAPSLWDFLPWTRFSTASPPTLSLYLDRDNEKSCQVHVDAPSYVKMGDLLITLNPDFRSVTASFSSVEKREQKDPEKGASFSSRVVRGSSTVGLPERCMSTAAVLMSHLGGVLLASETSKEHSRALVVLPSRELLQEYVEKSLLPETVFETIEKGDEAGKANLSDSQLCLAAGFTEKQCEKLGKKPSVAYVPAGAGGGGMPLPVYEGDMQILG